MSMSVSFFVGHDTQASTRHQDDAAVLRLERDDKHIVIFGPASFKDALDNVAAIFNCERVNSNVVQIGDHSPEPINHRNSCDAPHLGGDAA